VTATQIEGLLDEWQLTVDGAPRSGFYSVVQPVRTADGVPAMLKVGFPDDESEHEHLALRRWNGNGAVRLLGADPYRRALLLERLHDRDLRTVPVLDACQIVVDLYQRIHIPALPQLRTLSSYIARWNAGLAALPRSAPIPRRLVEQAVSLGRNLNADNRNDKVIHCDLHYENVLAANREPWLVIDPKPVNGDPHYELAPMLWNRWEELVSDVREGVRRRFYTLVDAAGLDENRARDWVIVRMMHNAMWSLEDAEPDHHWLTKCIAIAKAVQG
jgi:streptomycin 6-kinase